MNAAAGGRRIRGHDAMYLWVAEANEPARRLYERYGFTPTGDRQPLPSNPAVPEIRMRRRSLGLSPGLRLLFSVVRAVENRNKSAALARVVAAPPHKAPFLA